MRPLAEYEDRAVEIASVAALLAAIQNKLAPEQLQPQSLRSKPVDDANADIFFVNEQCF